MGTLGEIFKELPTEVKIFVAGGLFVVAIYQLAAKNIADHRRDVSRA